MQDSCAQTRLRESWSARKLDRPRGPRPRTTPHTLHTTHHTPITSSTATMGAAAAAHPPPLPSPSPSTAHGVPKNSQSPSCHPVGAAVYRRLSPSEIGGGGGVDRERRESEDAPGACLHHIDECRQPPFAIDDLPFRPSLDNISIYVHAKNRSIISKFRRGMLLQNFGLRIYSHATIHHIDEC